VSTSAQISPAWKEEVNRRLAEHRGRKGTTPEEPKAPADFSQNASRRAQEAAARVAARYRNAPSYSEVLANEARAALRAAEAASEAALQAKAAARSVLAGIEAAAAAPVLEPALVTPRLSPEDFFGDDMRSDDLRAPKPELARADASIAVEPEPEPAPAYVVLGRPVPDRTVVDRTVPDRPVSVRWDLDLPSRPSEPAGLRAVHGANPLDSRTDDWWRTADDPEAVAPEAIEMVEPAQPIAANLIEFPRELVATRKVRPRLAESPQTESNLQLSIFEVDPVSLSTEPEMEMATEATQPAWSDMKFDAQPQLETPQENQARALDQSYAIIEESAAEPAIQPAPLTLRMMALVVDGALIAGSLLAAAFMAASRTRVLPGVHATEIGLGVGLLLVAAMYEAFFFTLGRATPGMKYAKIRLATFDGQVPPRAQRCRRLVALLVSVLPVGLGVAWSLFDEDHLSWHDRLSRTYVCRK
jgi:uncharacterized RDD family membrane protein YckC